MRDYTNLCWPEAPFGADQRPFGRPARILIAVILDWALGDRSEPLPLSAAVVYLRIPRAGKSEARPDTLSPGFRVTVVDQPSEAPVLVELLDRALVRGRRHAVALAGHDLTDVLKALIGWSGRRLPGVTGVIAAWADRATKSRGMARMVDTRHDVADVLTTRVDVSLDPGVVATFPNSARDAELIAVTSLTRGLAIALVAAWHLDGYRWDGTFSVQSAVAVAAWDRFDQCAQSTTWHRPSM